MSSGHAPARPQGIVLVVDDDESMRDALDGPLRSAGWDVESFADAAEFLQRPPVGRPACLLLEARLPGTSGLELQRLLTQRGDAPPIVFMTGQGDIAMSVRAMKAGAVEFLSKPFEVDELLDAVSAALERDARAWRERAEVSTLRRRVGLLSQREREVMDLIVRGMLNKQVAAALDITEMTVKVHRRRVMDKMRARSLPDLVRMAGRLHAVLVD
jgi:FixJ family two-component response regulator